MMQLHFLPQPRSIRVSDIRLPLSVLDRKHVAIGDGIATNSEGYRLEVGASGVEIHAADEAGRFYAECTLEQLRVQAARAGELPALVIDDYPALPLRWLCLDMSRDRIPTMTELKRQIDQAARWKYNAVSLYFEHVFAYQQAPEVWEGSTPFTAEEIDDLRQFCVERHVRLIPKQESFGHLHRWLRVDRYRPLAECPQGFPSSWALDPTDPFSLCPTDPKAIDFVDSVWGELLPHFPDEELFAICCDETMDLGKGRSKEAVEKYGIGQVYMDFVKKLDKLCYEKYHRRALVDADIAHLHPEIMDQFPRTSIILDWGYRPDYDFDTYSRQFKEMGLDFILLGSNSSYTGFNGRTYRWRENINRMVDAAIKYGAMGVGVTEWGDNGHWNELVTAIPGDAYFAAMSWCPETNRHADLAAALDEFVFQPGSGAAALLMDCGRPYIHMTEPNSSDILWLFMMSPKYALDKLEEVTVDAERIFRIQADLQDLIYRLEHATGFAPRDLAALRSHAEWMLLVADVAQECLATGKTTGSQLAPESRKAYGQRYDAIAKELIRLRDDGTFRDGGRQDAVEWLQRFRENLCGK